MKPPEGKLGLLEFGKRYCSHHLTCEPSHLHYDLCEALDHMRTARGRRENWNAPRGSAKSTWITLIEPLRSALEGTEPYQLLIGDSETQGAEFLANIRDELENNMAIRDAYPDAAGVGPVWRYTKLKLRNGCIIEAAGKGSRIRGRKKGATRPTKIILDDAQDNDIITSEVKRNRDWLWLQNAVIPAGAPGCNIINVGTAIHRDGITCKLANPQNSAGWINRKYPSVARFPERMDLWVKWEDILKDPQRTDEQRLTDARRYYDLNKKAMDRGAQVLWPEREDLYALMFYRATSGLSAFASEKQGDPRNPGDTEWPAEYFSHDYFWFDKWPTNLIVKTLAIDPSKGVGEKGDDSAIVMYGRDPHGNEFVESDQRNDRDSQGIVVAGLGHIRRFNPDAWGIEANTFQSLFRPLFMAQLGVNEHIPDPKMMTNNVAKEIRVKRLTLPLTNRRMRFKSRSPGTARLVNELMEFPNGHVDGGDALEMARRLAVGLTKKKGKT